MMNRIHRARVNLEDKLHKLVWNTTLNGTDVEVTTFRNRLTGTDYLTIANRSETLVIKNRDGKLVIKSRANNS